MGLPAGACKKLMTHVAIITTSFPVDNSGAEAAGSFVADFAEELSSRARVTVLAPGYKNYLEDYKTYSVLRFIVPRIPLSLLNPANPADWYSIYQTIRSGDDTVNELQKQWPCDYIFAFWALPSGYWARHAMKCYGIPYSVWALGSDIWSLGKIPVVRNVLKKVLLDSHHCFADGHQLKSDVETIADRKCGFLPSTRRLDVTDRINIAKHPPYRLAYLGRWHPNKGVDLLLDALTMLSDDDWHKITEIRICGGGPLEEKISKEIEELQNSGRPVYKYGYLDKVQATGLLTWADYVLIPSRIESIPVVFSDAMQCGAPVIATPAGDLPVLLSKNRVGILATEVSGVAYYNAICRSLEMSPGDFSTDIMQVKKQFNIKSVVDCFYKCVESKNTISVENDIHEIN